jgi:spore germination protein YaaH
VGRAGGDLRRSRRAHAARATGLIVGLACAAAVLGLGASASAQEPGALLSVLGFQEETGPLARIDASAPALSTVGVDGVNLLPSGEATTAPDAHARAQLARAHADHLRAVLLVGNFDETIGDFYEPTAHALLGSSANVTAVAAQLARYVIRERWDGVSVDLESLLRRDAAGLVAFVSALRGDLPAGDAVNVDVTNYTHPAQYLAAGYELHALGAAASEITLMAYDQHGPWENRPGPVGALAWTRSGLAVVLRSIPASKIDLGVAGYGYAWRPREVVQVSDAQARELVAADHAPARFRSAAGEWTAKLSDGSTLWWSDQRSYLRRAQLALAEHLNGMAVWSLDVSDPLTPVTRE